MLALYAGLRQQEIAWLGWEDVDLEEGLAARQVQEGVVTEVNHL